MRRAARALIPFLAALAIGSAAGAAPLEFAADATSFTLANGLQVVVIPDHRAPIVTHMVWYKAGAADEVRGKSGIAHFLEHMMFKGTAAHPAGEFSATVTSVGGNENAFTTDDYTAYHQTVAKQHLALMMEFEADRMANLVLTDEAVLPERDVILEERRSRIDNDPGSQLGEAVGAALYQNSRYGIPTIGWEHEMAKLTREDAIAWYDRYYTPNNAILIVAGDVTEAEVRQLAEATYGKVARRSEPLPRDRAEEPPPLAARTVTLADSRVTQPMMQRAYLVPSYRTGEPGEGEALDVLAEILGGGTTSRLYRDLVVDKAVATAAGAYYRSNTLDDTMFGFYAVPRGEATLDRLGAEIDAAIATLIASGVTEEEMVRAKRRMIASAVYAEDSHEDLARVFGTSLATGETVEDVQNWPAAIDAVTADEVVAAARKYLDFRRSVTGHLVGAPAQSPS
jgi:zinc protease